MVTLTDSLEIGARICCPFASRFDQKRIGFFVIRPFWQFGFSQGLFKIAVQLLSPLIDFSPFHFATFDGQQSLAMAFDADGNATLAQRCSAGEQEPEQMHSV